VVQGHDASLTDAATRGRQRSREAPLSAAATIATQVLTSMSVAMLHRSDAVSASTMQRKMAGEMGEVGDEGGAARVASQPATRRRNQVPASAFPTASRSPFFHASTSAIPFWESATL